MCRRVPFVVCVVVVGVCLLLVVVGVSLVFVCCNAFFLFFCFFVDDCCSLRFVVVCWLLGIALCIGRCCSVLLVVVVC